MLETDRAALAGVVGVSGGEADGPDMTAAVSM